MEWMEHEEKKKGRRVSRPPSLASRKQETAPPEMRLLLSGRGNHAAYALVVAVVGLLN